MTQHKASKYFACFACAAFAALSLTACSNPLDTLNSVIGTPTIEEAQASKQESVTAQLSSPAIIEDGTLTVGIETSAGAPYVISGSNGYEGYDIDVASALAAELGLKVKFVEVASPTSEIGSTCDVVMSMTSNHSTGLTIVGSYAEEATAFFAKGEEQVITADTLNGATVGVQANSTSEQILKRSNLDVTENTYSNLNDAFEGLNNNEVTYVLCSAFSGSYLAELYDGVACMGTIDTPSSVGIAVAESNVDVQTAVQEALSKLNSDGVIDIIRAKWINGMSVLTSSSQIGNITISAGVAEGTVETAEGATGENVSQDGSTAGANAADIGY